MRSRRGGEGKGGEGRGGERRSGCGCMVTVRLRVSVVVCHQCLVRVRIRTQGMEVRGGGSA